jgi:hypothetical protein
MFGEVRAPKGHEDSWGLAASERLRLTLPVEDYFRMVSQYVEFGPKGPEHWSVWAN